MFENIMAKLAELEKVASEVEHMAQNMPLSNGMRDLMENKYNRIKIEARSLRTQIGAQAVTA